MKCSEHKAIQMGEQMTVKLKAGTDVNFYWSRREKEADTLFRWRETVYLAL